MAVADPFSPISRRLPALESKRPRHWCRLAVWLGAVLMVVAGCSLVNGFVSTIKALDRAGFGTPDISVESGDSYRITVKKNAEDLDAAAAEAAGVVWRELPLRIQRLNVTCGNGFGGHGSFSAGRTELERRFGPRDPKLDAGVSKGDVRTFVLLGIAALVVGLLVLIGIVVFIVVMVRRGRRRRPPPGPQGPPPAWVTQHPGGGYGPRP